MRHKIFTAPLLSLALLILFYKPLENSDFKTDAISLAASQLAFSGGTALAAPLAQLSTRVEPKTIATPARAPAYIPPASEVFPTPVETAAPAVEEAPTQDLYQFISQVTDTKSGKNTPAGVQVSGVFALPIIQQPKGDETFVSMELGKATLFQSAVKNGVTGLLAHNFLSGELFYHLVLGQTVHLVYQDGTVKNYQVEEISRFQKLDPASLRSELVELSTGKHLTTAQVFKRYYVGNDRITFQTCLENEGISNWGLLFVVAVPTR